MQDLILIGGIFFAILLCFYSVVRTFPFDRRRGRKKRKRTLLVRKA